MKDLRERCEKFVKTFSFSDAEQRDHCYVMLEAFACEIRNEALAEARCIAVKLCKEHKIDYNLCETISGRFRQLETAALAADAPSQ